MIVAHRSGDGVLEQSLVPDIHDGVRGVEFVEAAVASANSGNSWKKLE